MGRCGRDSATLRRRETTDLLQKWKVLQEEEDLDEDVDPCSPAIEGDDPHAHADDVEKIGVERTEIYGCLF